MAPAFPTFVGEEEVCLKRTHDDFHSNFGTNWLICLINNGHVGALKWLESFHLDSRCGEAGSLGSN